MPPHCVRRAVACGVMRSSRLTLAAAALSVLLTAVLTLASGGTLARAHTGFDFSTPADREVVDSPVSSVVVAFTGSPTPIGDGFVALTPQGELQPAVSVESSDGTTYIAMFDPPLAGGAVGLRWTVQASDGHVLEGAFSFTVDAPAPTTVLPTTTVPTPASDESTTKVSSPGGGEDDGSADGALVAADDAPSGRASASEGTDAAANPPLGAPDPAPSGDPAPSLEEFLDVSEASEGETMATLGRVVGFLGVTLALGALAFAAATMRGSRSEVTGLIVAVRALAGVVVIGAAIEYVGVSRLGDEALSSTWSTQPGFATALRVVGGVALALGLAATLRPVTRPLSASVLEDLRAPVDVPAEVAVRWAPDRRSIAAAVGAVAIVVSFWFDGHTVTKGIRVVHALVNSIHLLAASIWVGGVVSLAVLAWRRHRRGHPSGVATLALRFSGSATVALAAVGVAGLVMAAFVLDSPGDLTSTEWGQTMLLKTGAVALAASAGAYNHFRLLPRLEREGESPDLVGQLRSILTAEAILLVFVVVVTAVLVAAAT